MQDYFTSFETTGKPISSIGPGFPTGGDEIVIFEQAAISITTDPTANARCRWWQTALR